MFYLFIYFWPKKLLIAGFKTIYMYYIPVQFIAKKKFCMFKVACNFCPIWLKTTENLKFFVSFSEFYLMCWTMCFQYVNFDLDFIHWILTFNYSEHRNFYNWKLLYQNISVQKSTISREVGWYIKIKCLMILSLL